MICYLLLNYQPEITLPNQLLNVNNKNNFFHLLNKIIGASKIEANKPSKLKIITALTTFFITKTPYIIYCNSNAIILIENESIIKIGVYPTIDQQLEPVTSQIWSF